MSPQTLDGRLAATNQLGEAENRRMVEYINQLRMRGLPVREAAKEGAQLRLRPIMMTMLVATLGLLPAAMSHDIGSDSQRPFAIVIVGD